FQWTMVVLASIGLATVGLCQVNIATGFSQIGEELGVGFPSLALLIAWFYIGYGIAHIPGGFLATRIGVRGGLTIGMALLGAACIWSGLSPGYNSLLISRIIAGFGGGVYAAVAPAAAALWFPDRRGAF